MNFLYRFTGCLDLARREGQNTQRLPQTGTTRLDITPIFPMNSQTLPWNICNNKIHFQNCLNNSRSSNQNINFTQNSQTESNSARLQGLMNFHKQPKYYVTSTTQNHRKLLNSFPYPMQSHPTLYKQCTLKKWLFWKIKIVNINY